MVQDAAATCGPTCGITAFMSRALQSDIHQLKSWHLETSVKVHFGFCIVSPARWRQRHRFCAGWGCLEMCFGPVSRVLRWETGGRAAKRKAPARPSAGKSKYLSCDPHLSAHWCSFLGLKHYVSGKMHKHTVFIQCYPQRFVLNCQGL